jgi:glycosyltransferase involved in cell wall biosynthesis
MLDRSLASVVAACAPDDEVLVVDSASTDPDGIRAVAARHGVRALRSDRAGASVARNVGWRAARNEVVLFCDDDVWVDGGWAATFATSFADDRVGFVAGRIEVPPGQETLGLAVSILDRPDPATYDATTPGLLGHAASLAVRRAALESTGGFDEVLGAGARFGGSEDQDLFDRLFAAGWSGRYEPAALAWHDQWRDRLRMIVRLDYTYSRGRGARLAKLLKSRQWRRVRVVLREYLWVWGLSQLWFHLRRRDRFLVAVTAARLAGIAVGFVGGLVTPVREGHFRGRPRSSSS